MGGTVGGTVGGTAGTAYKRRHGAVCFTFKKCLCHAVPSFFKGVAQAKRRHDAVCEASVPPLAIFCPNPYIITTYLYYMLYIC